MERNKPTPEGRILGKQVARLTEVAIAEMKEAGIEPLERCASCAFRGGTFPNGCPETYTVVSVATTSNTISPPELSYVFVDGVACNEYSAMLIKRYRQPLQCIILRPTAKPTGRK